MKISTLSYLAAALSASFALADDSEAKPTQTVSTPNNYTAALEEYLEHGNNLELRQVGAGNLNGQVATAATQAGATTTWYMASPIGTTDTWAPFTYVQTFADVPDQWPTAGAGQIGMGTLVKQGKRDAAPTPAGFESGQPLVLELQNVVVTQPVVPVMEVTELVEVPPGYVSTNSTQISNHTTASLNQTALSTVKITATVNITSTHTVRVLPSQMNPEFMRPSLTAAP